MSGIVIWLFLVNQNMKKQGLEHNLWQRWSLGPGGFSILCSRKVEQKACEELGHGVANLDDAQTPETS